MSRRFWPVFLLERVGDRCLGAVYFLWSRLSHLANVQVASGHIAPPPVWATPICASHVTPPQSQRFIATTCAALWQEVAAKGSNGPGPLLGESLTTSATWQDPWAKRAVAAALAEPRSVGEAVVVFLMTLLPSHSRHEWFAHHPALQLREVHRSPWGESLLAVV